MKKIIIFLAIILYANVKIAKNILGENYFKYQKLIKTSLDKNSSIKDTILFLENNGLLNLFFKKEKTIHPTFIFLNNNPYFNTKNLYDSLENLGYLEYFPCEIKKTNNIYSITLELTQSHFINPVNLITELEKRKCYVVNIEKNNNFTYYISCKNEILPKTLSLKNKLTLLHKIKGVFWLKNNNFKKIYIKNFTYFYPYITFFDKNLNIIKVYYNKSPIKKLNLKIPDNTFYIKIQDYFTNKNLSRGIFIKGLK